ncbi:MAG: hypothetical protein KDC55_07365, partial [Ignavibacteriae bacterium]|nr:hypothetical protein [Ignavibacteriota bacterium]
QPTPQNFLQHTIQMQPIAHRMVTIGTMQLLFPGEQPFGVMYYLLMTDTEGSIMKTCTDPQAFLVV